MTRGSSLVSYNSQAGALSWKASACTLEQHPCTPFGLLLVTLCLHVCEPHMPM
jgi:hypothetical protein